MTEMCWYAIHTNPNAERAVFDQVRLLGDGYRAFYPFCVIRVRRKLGRNRFRDEDVPRPYFSRYLFVGVMPWCTLAPMFSMQGLSSIVCEPGGNGTLRPLRVKDEQMRELLSRAGEDGQVGTEPMAAEPDHPYLAGDVVEFSRTGPFAGFACTVHRLKSNGMLDVVTDILGASRVTEVHASVLGNVVERRQKKRA